MSPGMPPLEKEKVNGTLRTVESREEKNASFVELGYSKQLIFLCRSPLRSPIVEQNSH